MEAFHDYAYYYNMFYRDKDYAGEAQVVNEIIEKYGKQNIEKRILNIGCGTGRHDLELNKLGYKIHGIDLSDDMISIAKDNVPDGDAFLYEVQDARSFKVKSPYDIIISLFHVMSYQNTNEDLNRVFQCVNRALKEGGIFVFDAWYGPGVLSDRPEVRVKRVEDEKNLFVRIAEPIMYPNENIVGVQYNVNIVDKTNWQVRQINEVHNMRYFFKPEMEEMLRQNGFRLVECLDCSTLKIPNFNSWTTYFIAEKVK
ncbi:MAG: class I SAM-dependent methyltransferase [Lachnospiraceae bacterium]|nr:class I SAM-dependent methyltransferase [Lachnospiraceae bacterium]